ncbi:MAG TPA: MlaD family protein [Bacteroidia bacterium]|nr:MlaD family protein [Bacteroidia bacterium]
MKFTKEVKVGLLVTVALGGLFWGANYLKGIDIFSGTNRFYAIYSKVDGLVPSSDVLLSGVKVGQVEKIKFVNDRSGRIMVALRVSDKIVIGKNSTARIFSSDLLGGRAVELLIDSVSAPATDGDTLITEIGSTLTDQMEPLKSKAENLLLSIDSLATTMRKVFDPENKGSVGGGFESLNRTLANVERLSASLDNMITPSDGKLRIMIANMESISSTLKTHNQELSNVIENFSRISDTLAKANIANTINNADRTLAQSAELLEKINRGEGSLGLLANNDSLYNALTGSVVSLDSLLTDMKRNPKRYVHFSMFGKK